MAGTKRRRGKGGRSSVTPSPAPEAALATEDATAQAVEQQPKDLILPSEKRRGVYECDYCRSDISQQPRIRCAVCVDFDLCLDCFLNTDHDAAAARAKAQANAHSELVKDGVAVASADHGLPVQYHDSTHGYRVCDSTRYAILAVSKYVQGGGPAAASTAATRDSGDEVADAPEKAEGAVDAMEVDGEEEPKAAGDAEDMAEGSQEEEKDSAATSVPTHDIVLVPEDPKATWTAEEDLRLLDGIMAHGLGNWVEIADCVAGIGSSGKTPKRCMERYLDDFLGRFGNILPPYTVVDDNVGEEDAESTTAGTGAASETASAQAGTAETPGDEESLRLSKRRAVLMRSPSAISAISSSGRARKKIKVVSTDALLSNESSELWPDPYLPPIENATIGQEVGREQAYKAELAFVKATSSAATKEEADAIRKDWEEGRLPAGMSKPSVLPPRMEDIQTMPGADLAGFMPRREDFDIEWDNEAEQSLADMEFTVADTPQERELKLKVLRIYYKKQDERERRKQYIMSRQIYDYRKRTQEEREMPADERDLVRRMRLVERFHTPEEHKIFIQGLLKAKHLRKEIAKLQMYRRIGIRSLVEAEKYELDKKRRQLHKASQQQKDAQAKPKPNRMSLEVNSLWKEYRPSDRKDRRSGALLKGAEAPEDSIEAKTDASSAPEALEKSAEGNATPNPTEAAPAPPVVQPASDSIGDEAVPMETDEKEAPTEAKPVDFDITRKKGFDLLSEKEAALCTRLGMLPLQYLQVKTALIQESLAKGLLQKDGFSRRLIVKIDVEKRGKIVDFMLSAGWISTDIASLVRAAKPAVAA